MEGISKEVIEKIELLVVAAHKKDNAIIEVGENKYWERDQRLIIDDPRHEKIEVNSLSAIVTFIENNREGFKQENLFVHVYSPFRVRLFQKAGERNIRTFVMSAGLDNDVETFPFGLSMKTAGQTP